MHAQISKPNVPAVTSGQQLVTTDANSLATSALHEDQAFMVWSADDFYCFGAANSTPVAQATTMPRLRGGVVHVFTAAPGKTFIHAARTAGVNITAYVFPIGS